MNGKTAAMAFVAAIIIAAVASAFYYYVDDYATTTSSRVEEPYKRTENTPPSATLDENANPALKDSPNAAAAQP